MSNLRRKELIEHANAAIGSSGGHMQAHFKYTCNNCGERVVFADPNILWERGECHSCGHEQEVTEGGYLLVGGLSSEPV